MTAHLNLEVGHGPLLYTEMNKWIGKTVKHEWNGATYVPYIFGFCHKHNSLPLGPIQPLFPSTKELHVQVEYTF